MRSAILPPPAGFGSDPSRLSQVVQVTPPEYPLLRPSRPITPSPNGGDGPGVNSA